MGLLLNAHAGRADERASVADVRAFHRSLPGFAPTPLLDADALARELGLGRVWVKHERGRIGMPAFKALGASWAVRRALDRDVAGPDSPDLATLRARAADGPVRRLVAATDGNHGHAVALVARLLGLEARIYVPAGTARARVATIAAEGADLVELPGSYDDAVEAAAAEAAGDCRVISDTPCATGGEDTARWVIEGYATILAEVGEQLAAADAAPLDLVVVPFGTGGLTAAVARHLAALPAAPPRPEDDDGERRGPLLVAVEPDGAACGLASLRAGRIITIPAGPEDSIMAGLNCGTPSTAAWATVVRGVDGFLSIGDERACAAMRAYARAGVATSETGAAALGGLLELCGRRADGEPSLPGLTLGPDANVLVLCTEGVTDPVAYAEIVGEPATATERRAGPVPA